MECRCRLDRLRYYRQEHIVLLKLGYSVLIFMLVCVTLSSQTSTILSVPALSSYPGYPLSFLKSRKSFPLIDVKLSSIKRSPVNIALYGYEINVLHLPEKNQQFLGYPRYLLLWILVMFSWSSLKSLRGHLRFREHEPQITRDRRLSLSSDHRPNYLRKKSRRRSLGTKVDLIKLTNHKFIPKDINLYLNKGIQSKGEIQRKTSAKYSKAIKSFNRRRRQQRERHWKSNR